VAQIGVRHREAEVLDVLTGRPASERRIRYAPYNEVPMSRASARLIDASCPFDIFRPDSAHHPQPARDLDRARGVAGIWEAVRHWAVGIQPRSTSSASRRSAPENQDSYPKIPLFGGCARA